MKVLLVTSEPPLPFGHVSARWYYVLIQQMSLAGYQITVLSACSKEQEMKEAEILLAGLKGVKFHGFSFTSSLGLMSKLKSLHQPGSHQFSTEFIQCFQEVSKNVDLIHCEQLMTGIVAGSPQRVPTIINVHHLLGHDLQGESGSNLKEKVIHWRQIQFEKVLLKRFRYITAVSAELVDRIGKIHPGSKKEWIPFALSSENYTPKSQKRAYHFGMVGNMNWFPSYSAAKNVITQIWPKIRQTNPRARLLVAGWDACKRLSEYTNVPGLTLKENVPDIREVFQDIETLIYFPKQGSGVKVKILEAMLMECTIITNSSGVEGLSVKSGEELLVCDDADLFTKSACDLLEDSERRQMLAEKGRAYVLDFHQPGRSFQKLQEFYRQML